MDIVQQLAQIASTRPEILKKRREKGTKIVGYCGVFYSFSKMVASSSSILFQVHFTIVQYKISELKQNEQLLPEPTVWTRVHCLIKDSEGIISYLLLPNKRAAPRG